MYNIIVGTLIFYRPGDDIFYEIFKTPMAQFVVHSVDLRFVRRSGSAYARASARRTADASLRWNRYYYCTMDICW
jgi:hypothetical protein